MKKLEEEDIEKVSGGVSEGGDIVKVQVLATSPAFDPEDGILKVGDIYLSRLQLSTIMGTGKNIVTQPKRPYTLTRDQINGAEPINI